MNIKVIVAGGLRESCQNGNGIRNVLFLAGCSRHCLGCHNKEIQNKDVGDVLTIDEVIKYLLNDDSRTIIDGVTISGGEPFEQPEALLEITKRLKNLGVNIWIYSGYTYDELSQNLIFCEILKNINVLVDGEFKKDLKTNKRYRGSDNQRILYLKGGKVIDIK